jgi:phosphatidylinositol alpha-1,6-mannosyltransferase
MEKKRVLIVTRNFPPLVGGMERLIFNVYDQLGKDFICDVVGPDGCSKYVNPPHSAYECSTKYVSLFLLTALFKSIKLCLKKRYNICIAGSGVTAPVTLISSIFFSFPSIVYIHGLDLVAQNIIYQNVFVPLIRKQSTVITNSNNTSRLAQSKGIKAGKIKVLFPGVELPQVSGVSGIDFIQKYALENKKILLSVGRLVPRKGIVEFIKYSLPKIIRNCPDATLVIIGSEPKDALKKGVNLTKEIASAIKQMELGDHVLLLGNVGDKTLKAAYSNAVMLIFPLLEILGDVEGFGMVAVEAASFGLPTIGFSVGGLPDAVEHGRSGLLLEPGHYTEMADEIVGYLQHDNKKISKKNCVDHAKKFTWNRFGEKLREICISTIEKFNLAG